MKKVFSIWYKVYRVKKLYSKRYILNTSLGFTLIELLVVVGIVAVLVAVALPGLGRFDSYQALQDAAYRLHSDLRTAQNNASSGVKCGDNINPTARASTWNLAINSASQYSIQPSCNNSQNLPRTVRDLAGGVSINSVYVDETDGSDNASGACFTSTITFDNISSAVNFQGTSGYSVDSRSRMAIVLGALGAGSQRLTVFVEKGGAIYVSSNAPPTVTGIVCMPTPTPALSPTVTLTPTPNFH